MNVWTGTKWVNIYDGNDMRNMNIDLHAVSKAVESAQADIGSAQSAADNAVKAADSAVSASKVNSDAIDAQNKAISSVKETANSALDDAKSAVANASSTAASIRNNIANVQANVTSTAGQLRDEFSDAQADLKVQVDKNSAAILKNSGDIEIQERTASDAIADIKVANGQIKEIAQDAKSNATIAIQNASTATVMASNANSDVAQVKLTADSASFTATNAKNDVAQVKATAEQISAHVSAVESDANKRITANSTAIEENKKAIILKADQSTVDSVKGELSQTNAQLRVQADQISSKVSSTDVQAAIDNVQVGGQNLVPNSGKDIVVESKQTDAYPQWDNVKLFLSSDNGKDLENGKTYVFSVSATNTNGVKQASIRVFSMDENKEAKRFVFDADGKRHSFSFTVPDDEVWYHIYLYAGPMEQNQKKDFATTYHQPQLQYGAKATEYSPSPTDTVQAIKNNTTAIEQNKEQLNFKASQQAVDMLNGKVSSNASQLTLLNNSIQSKVDSTTVNNLINSKGFITQEATQTLIDQKADTINESITGLSRTVNGNNATVMDKIQSITASVDGVQSTVVNKADKSTVTQLANALQIKMTGSTIAQAKDVTLKYTGKDNEYPSVAPLIGLSDVEKGTQVELNFDYTASADVKFIPQFDGAPWIPWGFINDGVNDGVDAKKGVKGHYSKVITVGDDSWQKGTATNLAIKCDKYTGTIKIENLLLKKADTKHDVQSTVDMLRDDINLRVTKGDLLSQINLEAGRMLIQSNKIYLDADSVVFGKNSKAFIPSAAITNLSADKITSGTLDAAYIRVINLTADNIHDGTLDVGSMHVKNFSADDIASGTLRGITFEAGNSSNGFIIDGNGIDWHRKVKDDFGVMQDGHSKIGYFSDGEFDWGQAIAGSLSITDSNEIRLSLDSIVGESTGPVEEISNMPKIILTKDDTIDPRADRHKNGSLSGMQQITLWTSRLEYMQLTRHKGFDFNLDSTEDDGMGRNWAKASQFRIQKDNCIGAYFGNGDQGNEINLNAAGGIHLSDYTSLQATGLNVTSEISNLSVDNLHVKKWLGDDGYKHSTVKTSQGLIGVNAYETAEYYFGDIGENNTGNTSQVVIGIDRIFNETVNTDIQYQVFVTPYSDAHIWVEKRYNNRFVICSDKPNAEFGWEIKAKRKEYERTRLQNFDNVMPQVKRSK